MSYPILLDFLFRVVCFHQTKNVCFPRVTTSDREDLVLSVFHHHGCPYNPTKERCQGPEASQKRILKFSSYVRRRTPYYPLPGNSLVRSCSILSDDGPAFPPH